MTDTSYHEAWISKPHHHTVHNDQHSSYMCEHCSRLTPPSPPVKVLLHPYSTVSAQANAPCACPPHALRAWVLNPLDAVAICCQASQAV